MNDDGKELLKIGMEAALRPITEIAENAIGLLGGDWLSETRARNRERLKEKTAETLKRRKVEKAIPPAPSITLPLLTGAQDESRDELLDLWAKLLAAAADPARRSAYRREFAEIVKGLEPLDAAALQMLIQPVAMQPTKRAYVASQLGVSEDQMALAFRNLHKLDLTDDHPTQATPHHPQVKPLGRELLAVLSN